MITYFVIGNFRDTFSSVNMLKGYMLICWNAEGVHGQKKVGNPWSSWCIQWKDNALPKKLYELTYNSTSDISITVNTNPMFWKRLLFRSYSYASAEGARYSAHWSPNC